LAGSSSLSFLPGLSETTGGKGSRMVWPCGDHLRLAARAEGDTQIAWGEAASYAGPGNIWTAHSRQRWHRARSHFNIWAN